jgi:hypothetical protein
MTRDRLCHQVKWPGSWIDAPCRIVTFRARDWLVLNDAYFLARNLAVWKEDLHAAPAHTDQSIGLHVTGSG